MAGISHFLPAAAAPTVAPFDKKLFLLDRITFGWDSIAPSPGQLSMSQEYDNRGYMGFLNWQLTGAAIPDGNADTLIAADSQPAGQILPLTPYGILYSGSPGLNPCTGGLATPNGAYAQGAAISATYLKGSRSRRQLQVVMADFWSTVHSTFILQQYQYLMWWPFYRDVLLKNALGEYGTKVGNTTVGMVPDSAKGGSMLWYLNQWQSLPGSPIENYARELLELHTLGVKQYLPAYPTFNENDVVEAAKMLTGWSMVAPAPNNTNIFNFLFNGGNATHSAGTKTNSVTNWPNSGPKNYPLDVNNPTEGEDLIVDLVRHPLTALHMSERLIHWFLGDSIGTFGAPGEFFNHWIRVANQFHATGGNLNATVRTLFDEQWISELRPGRYRKVRRPLNMLIGLLRATGAKHECANTGWASGPFYKMQHVPGFWPAPNGFPAENEAWGSSMVARIEFLHEIVHKPNLGLDLDATRLLALFPAPTNWAQLATLANTTLFGGGLPAAEVAAAQAYLDTLPHSTTANQEFKRREAIVMTFSLPSYQFHY